MFKKIISVLLVISTMFCVSGCFGEKQYVYNGVGSFMSKYSYVFDKPVKSKDGGNYKVVFTEDWEKIGDYKAVDSESCFKSGTFKWDSEAEVLTLTTTKDDAATEEFYVINDILVPTYLYDFASEGKKVGDYIDGTASTISNITVYYPNGTYIFYVADSEGNLSAEYGGDYTKGEYYIDGNLIYTKSPKESEYEVSGLFFDGKVIDLSLSAAYVLEK